MSHDNPQKPSDAQDNDSINVLSNNKSKPRKPRKSRKGSSLKRVNIERLAKKLMNVLDREVNSLLKLSATTGLEKDDANNLVNYLKLVKNLQKESYLEEENLTDEELEKIAAKA